MYLFCVVVVEKGELKDENCDFEVEKVLDMTVNEELSDCEQSL